MTIPEDVQYVARLEYHQVVFDPTRAARGLVFDHGNTMLSQNISSRTFKTALGRDGWSDGRHFFSFKLINNSPTNFVTIGVSDGIDSKLITGNSFPGHKDKGVSYYGSNGAKYLSATSAPFGPSYGFKDEVGVLLNM